MNCWLSADDADKLQAVLQPISGGVGLSECLHWFYGEYHFKMKY
jgi:hypothetical protein